MIEIYEKDDNVAKRIKMLINEKGYKNQKEFCLAIEKKYKNVVFPQPLLTDIFKGKRRTIDNIKVIANMLDSSIDYICCNTDSRNRESVIKISDIIGLDDISVSKLERFNNLINYIKDKNISIKDIRNRYWFNDSLKNEKLSNEEKKEIKENYKELNDEENAILYESYELSLSDYYDNPLELKEFIEINNILDFVISDENFFPFIYLLYLYFCNEDIDDFYMEVFYGDIESDNEPILINKEMQRDILFLELKKVLDEFRENLHSSDSYYQNLLKRRDSIKKASKEKGYEYISKLYDLEGLENRIEEIKKRRKQNEK